ncbi:mechanosensitive ion channel family protein [Microbacterium sp. SORGH_AS_0888]|uniref:mechanosensitive ion channel family protein n=1 Tax=Microbacterium sp. SORGH_AS_0888 TaxID=3041791 RepID=UPI002780D32E|nr:mechanosensitive ion channel family protein [Microbacterium sp. SORGH_AS_0888]MDQ1131239.1 small-conductance mechanosensitive channel [Microbacterium sp. SORGH_AS_0888]
MNALLGEGWVWWAFALAVGLPLVLVVLTEVISILRRRRSPVVKPLLLLRNWVVPVAALVALLAFATRSDQDLIWVRIVGTVFGFLLILLVLSALNVALFSTARAGTWRERVPTIFIEIARLLLVVVGLALLFQVVWQADVGGLIAALGVTSIVIGLALQNAVGGIVSGLLVLFEQPFKIGDWIDTGDANGRVVEVNWRALHIETGSGVQVIPNAKLAAASFRNLSRPAGPFAVTIPVVFAPSDPPERVRALLRDVGERLPQRLVGRPVEVDYLGAGSFSAAIPVLSPALQGETTGVFLGRLWYAARRAGLALDKIASDPEQHRTALAVALEGAARALHLDGPLREDAEKMCRIETYAAGELLGRAGEVPDAVRYVVAGSARVTAPTPRGDVECGTIDAGELIGSAALTRERSRVSVVTRETSSVLVLPVEFANRVIRAHPIFASELGADLELRREQAAHAVDASR